MTETAKQIISKEIQKYDDLHSVAIIQEHWKDAGKYEAVLKALAKVRDKL